MMDEAATTPGEAIVDAGTIRGISETTAPTGAVNTAATGAMNAAGGVIAVAGV
jgi:hypothetical protein